MARLSRFHGKITRRFAMMGRGDVFLISYHLAVGQAFIPSFNAVLRFQSGAASAQLITRALAAELKGVALHQ